MVVICNFFLLCTLSSSTGVGNYVNTSYLRNHWYLGFFKTDYALFATYAAITSFILYN